MKRGRAVRSALLHSIVRIQALWRAHKARTAFSRQRQAALAIQVPVCNAATVGHFDFAVLLPCAPKATGHTASGHLLTFISMISA